MAKQSGYSALLESLTRSLQVPKNVANGATNSAGGIFGGLFNAVNKTGDIAARQTSKVINTGNWMFEKFPVIATIASVAIFWKPIKNSFNKMMGREDPQTKAYKQEVRTARQANPYMANDGGPQGGRSSKYWQNYVNSTRGMPPTPGQDGF